MKYNNYWHTSRVNSKKLYPDGVVRYKVVILRKSGREAKKLTVEAHRLRIPQKIEKEDEAVRE